jgi:hypothetical protein
MLSYDAKTMKNETTIKYQDLLNSCQAYLLCMIMENIWIAG